MQPNHAVHTGLSHLIRTIDIVSDYNNEFSLAGHAAKLHVRILDSVINSTSNAVPVLADTDSEAITRAEQIFRDLQPKLSTIGLLLVHDSSTRHTLQGEPEKAHTTPKATPPTLSLGLHSYESLEHFLNSLTVADVKGEKAKQTLSFLAAELEKAIKLQSIKRRLNLNPHNATELCDAAELLIETLKTLRIETYESHSLSESVEHAWSDTLREHQMAKAAAILPTLGASGPQTWHERHNMEQFRCKWEKAVAALDTISLNPAAGAMASQIKSHLLTCLQSAEEYCKARNLLTDTTERSPAEIAQLLSAIGEMYTKITALDLKCN
jgi:hypothetical protein